MVKIEELINEKGLITSKVDKLSDKLIDITRGLVYKNIKQSPVMKLQKTVFRDIKDTDSKYLQIILASEPISFTKISGLMNAGENLGMFSDLDIFNGWICPEHEDLSTEDMQVDPKSYSTNVTDIELLKYHIKKDFTNKFKELDLVDEENEAYIETCVHPVDNTLSVSRLVRDFTIVITIEWVA